MDNWDIILDPRLENVYQVDIDSLKRNRQGHMTPQQQERLRKRLWFNVRRKSVSLLIALALLLFSFLIPVSFIAIPIQILIVAFIVIRGLHILSFYRTAGREIAAGNVHMYPGRLQKKVHYGTRMLFCERGVFYNLPDIEWDAFDHFQRYRVYCTPRTRMIVGAQPVHRNEPLPEAWS